MSRTVSSPTFPSSISSLRIVKVTVQDGRSPSGSRIPVGTSSDRTGAPLARIAATTSRTGARRRPDWPVPSIASTMSGIVARSSGRGTPIRTGTRFLTRSKHRWAARDGSPPGAARARSSGEYPHCWR